jgi:hypothetical protein
LFIDSQSQRFFAILVHGQQIEIIIRSPVQHPSAVIHRGIDQRMGLAAILRLDMEREVPESEIGVVPENHRSFLSPRPPARLPGFPARLARKISRNI